MSEAKPTELLPEQEAYNDGIEAAKRVIREEKFQESDTRDYIVPCLLNAIARKTNPHSYTRAQSPAQAECPHLHQDFPNTAINKCLDCGKALSAQAEWLPTPEEAQLLIDYHKQQATMGEPMGYDVSYHDQRIVWLKQFALPQPPKGEQE